MGDLYLKICDNCFDYDRKNKECMIRYTIMEDNSRIPMKRSATQSGCNVFIYRNKRKI